MSRIKACFVIMIVSTIVLSITLILSAHDFAAKESPVKSRISSYTSHLPISISGNSEFLGPNATTGISWGSGTKSDPYIIRGWDIISDGSQSAIFIGNSNVFFKIMDCRARFASTWSNAGIHLIGVSNGFLINNTCTNNTMGILLESSSGLTVADNTCAGNFRGVYVSYSNGSNTWTNNDCRDNTYGLYFEFSSGNAIVDNSCSYCGVGITLSWNSNRNQLHGNYVSNCSTSGIDVGQGANGNTLTNNTCSNNTQGIFVYACANNSILDNSILGNVQYGIRLESSCDNLIWNNTFIGNNGAGSTYDPDHVQAFCFGPNNRWNSSGLLYNYGNYWSDWKTFNYAPWGIMDFPYVVDGNYFGFVSKDYFPHAPDSDLDGIPDDWEVNLGLNPLDPTDALVDRDSDGLISLNEFWHGTNLTNPDTDYDGMLDGWEVNNGLSPLFPGDAALDEDNDGLSNVAEHEQMTNPNNWDTDGDGLSDSVEMIFSRTNPLVADTDGDSVSDGIEFVSEGGYAAMVQILSDNWTEMRIFWSGFVISIRTNSSVLSATFDQGSETLVIGVSGPNGTRGACEIAVPKAMVNSSSNISVLLDNQEINFTLTQNDTYYVISMNYTHSTHELKTDFARTTLVPTQASPLSWELLVLGAAVITSVLAAALVSRRRMKKARAQNEELNKRR